MVGEVTTGWAGLSEKVVAVAKEVCGVRSKGVENPWMVGRGEVIGEMRRRLSGAIERRNGIAVEVREGREVEERLEEARVEVRRERGEWRRTVRRWEREYWDEVIGECNQAEEVGDIGRLYKTLRRIGMKEVKKGREETNISTAGFKVHFSKVSKDRFENDPQFIEEVVSETQDLRGTELAAEWSARLNRPPEREEILGQMGKMKDGAPGEDGVRLSYLLKGGVKVHDKIVEVVRFMFCEDADRWDDALKSGVVVPLFKKGDRDDPGNYRGVCLLSMGSRVLARIIAARLLEWAEAVGALDDDQQGFRKGRSTADATQVMVRIHEDAKDLEGRRLPGEEVGKEDVLVAQLLDLKKAYPRVNKRHYGR